MECRRFSQTMASEWQSAFVVCHKMPWCALLTAVKNYNKGLEKLQGVFLQDQDQMFKTKTKTFNFVLEAPQDQDPGLEDYITATFIGQVSLPCIRQLTQVAYTLPFSFNKNPFPVRMGRYSQNFFQGDLTLAVTEKLNHIFHLHPTYLLKNRIYIPFPVILHY